MLRDCEQYDSKITLFEAFIAPKDCILIKYGRAGQELCYKNALFLNKIDF